MTTFHTLLSGRFKFAASSTRHQLSHRKQTWAEALWFLAIILVICVACTDSQALEVEEILKLGPVLEYELSSDEELVAVLLPANAAEPGSDNYLSVVRESVIDGVGIFIFDLGTQEPIAQFDVDSYTIGNLRWSNNDDVVLYLDRGEENSVLVSWQLETGRKEETPFWHGGFNIAPDNRTIVAWGKRYPGQTSNVLEFYSWPQLSKTDSFTLPYVKNIKSAQWSSDGYWLLLDTSSGLYQLVLETKDYTRIDSNPLRRPEMNASNTLIAFDTPSGLYSLQGACIVKYFNKTGIEQMEWGAEPQELFFTVRQTPKSQDTLARVSLLESAPSCLSE